MSTFEIGNFQEYDNSNTVTVNTPSNWRLGDDEQSIVEENKMVLSPNPVQSDYSNLNIQSLSNQTVEGVLINTSGQIAKKFFLDLQIGSNNKKLEVNGLSNGVYILKLKLASGTIVRKLKIQR